MTPHSFLHSMGLRRRSGAMLLITVLTIGGVALLVSLSIALRGVRELSMGSAEEKSAQAAAIADGCMEEALLRLTRSSAYTGSALTYGNGSCAVLVTGSAILKTVSVTATVGAWSKELDARVTVDTGSVVMDFWTEAD